MKSVNNKNIKSIAALGLFALLTNLGLQPALAGAGGSGGGSFIYLDNAPEMADPFVKIDSSAPGDEYKLSEIMSQYLKGIKELLERYNVSDFDQKAGREFWENEVLGKDVIYRWVETSKDLPCQDVMDIDPSKVPNGNSVQVTQYGCTKDHITYFARSEFENKPLRLQALGILHERLHSFSGDQGHARISPFISTLDRMITMKRAQDQGSHYAPLSPLEITQWEKSINELAPGMGFQKAFQSFGPRRVTKDGGVCSTFQYRGISRTCDIDSESTIGVGSVIDFDSVVRSSKILNSRVSDSIIENTEVANSTLYHAQAAGAKIALSHLAGQLGYIYHSTADGKIVVAPQVSIHGLNLRLSNGGKNNRLVLNPKGGKLSFDGTKTCALEYRTIFGAYMFSNEVELTEDSEHFFSNCM